MPTAIGVLSYAFVCFDKQFVLSNKKAEGGELRGVPRPYAYIG